MSVKLIDVANKAGVSKSTASQYLNGRYKYMSLETKERIRVAIEELNFVPNQIARSLKTEKTNTIGIIVSNITGPITSQVIRGVDDHCKKNNYNLLIYNTDYIKEIEKKSIATLNSLKADGLIITSSGEINDLLNTEDQGSLPIVHIHRDFDGLNVNTVLSDYTKGAYEATEYLIQLGHTRIGVITRPYDKIPSRRRRLNGCKNALENNHIPFDSNLVQIAHNKSDIEIIYNYFMSLTEPPTVIFTMYSMITIDLLRYLNTHNISIPEDISLLAFDDLPLADLLKVPLTVVNQQSYELGEKAAALLLDKIAFPKKQQENVTLPCNLIIRSSCKKK
jgi:LacI family transcriptional regulator